jgi:class 3 adenylate cyclase
VLTDIIGSTQQARRLGDRRWRELLTVHDELARRLIDRAGGRLVNTTGDGIMATFDGPGRGIHCAIALGDQLRGIDVRIRAGLHVGEVERRDDDVGGMAVHIPGRPRNAAAQGRRRRLAAVRGAPARQPFQPLNASVDSSPSR